MNDEVLKESLQDLYESAPCGYIFTAPDGSLLRVNQTFLDWTGYSRDELLSRRLQDLLTVAGKIFYENQYAPLLRLQGAVREVALDLLRRDGTRLPVLINSVLSEDDKASGGVVASTIFSAADRRAYEQELLLARTRAEQLADVVTASIDAILTCSIDGVVRSWNASAERLLGYAPGELATRMLSDLLPSGGDAGYEPMMQSLRAGKPLRADTVAVRANGELIDVSVSITPHTDDLGHVTSLSAIIGDISERRALERLQQEFLAMASHELRTPLLVIQGQAQLMQRRNAYNESGIESIISQTRQLARLIDDLLLASQIEADRFGVHLVELDLVSVVESAVHHILGVGHAATLQVPDCPVMIQADRQRLYQVFANLLANASKYSHQGSKIEVRVMREDDDARVDIIDHGIGIPSDVIPHLFERFYRAPNVVEQTKGAGLGLYITHRIVEAHGGRISVESEVGKGSTFTLRLPLVTESLRPAEPAAAIR